MQEYELPNTAAFRPQTGAASYDASQWTGARPTLSHVVVGHYGVSAFLQNAHYFSHAVDIAVESNLDLCLLIWRSGLRKLQARVGDDSFAGDFDPGCFAVLPRETPSLWLNCHHNPSENIHIHIEARRLIDICLRELNGADPPSFGGLLGHSDPLVLAIGEAMLDSIRRDAKPERVYWESLTTTLIVHLLRRWRDHHPGSFHPRKLGGLAAWQVRKVEAYMRERLAEDISLAELAAVAGLSPFHFARAFKRTVGVPPHRFLVEMRVAEAQRLLMITQMNVLEIALCVGYQTNQSFARAFAAVTGAAPSAYRRSIRS